VDNFAESSGVHSGHFEENLISATVDVQLLVTISASDKT